MLGHVLTCVCDALVLHRCTLHRCGSPKGQQATALIPSSQQPSGPADNKPWGQKAIALKASRQQQQCLCGQLSLYCLVIDESWGAGALAEGDSG